MVRSAAYGYLKMGYETAFQTENNSKTKVFGLEQKINGLQFMVNRINLAQLDSIELQAFAFGRNEGKMSIDFILSNPWWLDAIFHPYTAITTNPVNNGGEFTYTWSSAQAALSNNTQKTYAGNSLSIDLGFQGELSSGINLVRTALGAIVTQVSIKTAVNDTVRCSADVIWGNEKAIGSNAYDQQPPSDDISFPYTFVHGTIQTNSGGLIAQVQDVDLTMNANSELLWGIGAANAVSAFRKVFDVTSRFNCAVLDQSLYNAVINRTEVANFTLTFDNGLAGTNRKAIVFTGSGVGFADVTENIVPVDPVFQELNLQIRSLQVQAFNNKSTPP